MTKEFILNDALAENVKYIRLQFTDMLGTIKAVEIPASKLSTALDGKIMFDGSSIEGFVRIKEADMYLHPDYDTWQILNDNQMLCGKTARLICDVYLPNGQPFTGDPRHNLKRVLKKMNDLGFHHFNIGAEPEFYLFKQDENGRPIMDFSDNGSYFDLAPIDGSEHCRHEIVLELEKAGFLVEASHHEVGPGQNEINFHFADALEACDKIQVFKQIVHEIARKHNLFATFMPKPVAGKAGNGLHINCSLADSNGNNLFVDPSKPMGLSDLCIKWITGILNNARGISAITNASVNSYKRIVPGYEAPCYVCWSDANRSSMIRIPATRGNATRVEIRNVDSASNPYLVAAAILEAGLDGIMNSKETIPPVYDNIFDLTREERESMGIMNLPENLKDAVKEMKKSQIAKSALGEHIFTKYVIAKELEWEEYRVLIHPWELEKYFKL